MASSSSSIFILMLIAIGLYYIPQYFLIAKKCESDAKIDGKVVIVTGANSGIGRETARDLVHRGGTVVLACRSLERCNAAATDIINTTQVTKERVIVMKLDLGSLTSVRLFSSTFKSKFKKLNILVNNAGVMSPPFEEKTADGFEQTMGINHLGHFLLTNILVDMMMLSGSGGRIVTLSSEVHVVGGVGHDIDMMSDRGWASYQAYADSKLANMLFSFELARKLYGTGITTYSVSPGFVLTGLFRNYSFPGHSILHWLLDIGTGIFINTPMMGAQTTICCAINEDLEKETGKYYHHCSESSPSVSSTNKATARWLWDESTRLVNMKQDKIKWLKDQSDILDSL